MSNGYIIYQGASLLDGAPIVVIATGFESRSTNRKTGAMIQTYILREDSSPIDAVKSGADSSICGDCLHRGKVVSVGGETKNVGRTCYVNVGQGALSVWNGYKRGIYPAQDQAPASGKFVRLGTYGDPAAVPAVIWLSLLRGASGHTGYTHQWRNPALSVAQHQHLKTLCMASADTAEEAALAQSMGWRTFRVALDPEREPIVKEGANKEVLCPASAEAGKKLTCAECLACGGADGRRSSIYIPAHGGFGVMANIKRRRAA
jgi:hypothetical protein